MRSRRNRDQMVVATKVYGRTGPRPGDVGLSRAHILDSVDKSLRRFGVEHIDLYQAHFYDASTPLHETLSTFDQLVRSGKVRYLGASNFAGWQLMKSELLSQLRGYEPLVAVQPEYNLLARQTEWEIIPVCRDLGLGLIPWSPLGGGWLTGKHRVEPGRPAAGTRVADSAKPWQPDSWDKRNTDQTRRVVQAVGVIAADRGVPYGQVALNWLRRKPIVTSPLVGARNVEQLTESLGCVEWSLDEAELQRLDEVSAIPPPYPVGITNEVAREERLP